LRLAISRVDRVTPPIARNALDHDPRPAIDNLCDTRPVGKTLTYDFTGDVRRQAHGELQALQGILADRRIDLTGIDSAQALDRSRDRTEMSAGPDLNTEVVGRDLPFQPPPQILCERGVGAAAREGPRVGLASRFAQDIRVVVSEPGKLVADRVDLRAPGVTKAPRRLPSPARLGRVGPTRARFEPE
jgi:hypothetical protein